jgi:hypothetical protein
MTLEEKCKKIDGITRAMSDLSGELIEAAPQRAALIELVIVGLWYERDAIVKEIDEAIYA